MLLRLSDIESVLEGNVETKAVTAEYDAAAEASLKAKVESIFREVAAMNFEVLRPGKDVPELVVYDYTPDDQPFTARGPDEYGRLVDMFTFVAGSGTKMETVVQRIDCHATSSFGYCLIEYDQRFMSGGSTMGPYRMRGTLVARRKGDDWIVTHSHVSFRERPEVAFQPEVPR
jgi:hypothetical protein